MATRTETLTKGQKALQAGEPQAALDCAQAALDEDAVDGEALYLAAVAARYGGHHPQAAVLQTAPCGPSFGLPPSVPHQRTCSVAIMFT